MIKKYELKTDKNFILCSYNTKSRKCKIIHLITTNELPYKILGNITNINNVSKVTLNTILYGNTLGNIIKIKRNKIEITIDEYGDINL